MLKTAIKKAINLFKTVKCSICEKDFDKNATNTFKSDKKMGPVVYFCPQCNKDLSCNFCRNKLGTGIFELHSEKSKTRGVRDVIIICENCLKAAGEELPIIDAEGNELVK